MHNEVIEALSLLIDCVDDALKAAQALPGNNWDLRRELMECAAHAMTAKRHALRAAKSNHAPH